MYIRLPGSTRIYKLLKSLYGLKQGSRVWYDHLRGILVDMSFIVCPAEPCIFTKDIGTPESIILAVIVDDLAETSPSEQALIRFETELQTKLTLSSVGNITQWNGCKVEYNQQERTISFNYSPHITALLKKTGMDKCIPVDTPAEPNSTLVPPTDMEILNTEDKATYMSIVGAIMYLACQAYPEIQHAVNRCASYMHTPGTQHMTAAKRILRYLAGTLRHAKPWMISYKPNQENFSTNLITYSDASWGGDLHCARAWTGVIVLYNGGPIAWQSKRQPTTALSSAEAEYMALTEATKTLKYLKAIASFLRYMDASTIVPLEILTDSQSGMHIAMNPVSSQRSRHINVRHHYIRENIVNSEISLRFVGSSEQIADILTKALPTPQFRKLVQLIYVQ